MGNFSEKALEKFNSLCSERYDFSEGETYDFVRCIMPNGEIYGTSKQCKQGKPLPEEESKGEKKGGEDKAGQRKLAKLTRMYRLRTGRDMTAEQLASAANKIGVPIPQGKTAEQYLQELLPKGEKVVPVKSA